MEKIEMLMRKLLKQGYKPNPFNTVEKVALLKDGYIWEISKTQGVSLKSSNYNMLFENTESALEFLKANLVN